MAPVCSRLGDICARHKVLVVAHKIHGDSTFARMNIATTPARLKAALAGWNAR